MTPAQPLWRRLLAGWQEIAGRFGEVQTILMLSLFYGLLIGPLGTLASLARRDLLGRRGLGEPGSAWGEAETSEPDLDRLKQQF